LQAVTSPSEYLRCRLAILGAGGLNPSPLNPELRAYKSAWETYLTAAFAIGLFDGTHGTDLRARLTCVEDDNHLGAIGECFDCLSGRAPSAISGLEYRGQKSAPGVAQV
jgi:hypothetical protein